MNTYILGIGSNIHPEENIRRVKDILSKRFKILAESKFVVTRPVGFNSKDNFINGALRIETDLTLDQLRKELKEIEQECGRTPESHRFNSRTVDLDILVMNNEVIDQDFYERDFIRASVLELSPTVKHSSGKS